MIRCRRCGIIYKDTATMCLRCMNPLGKPLGKEVNSIKKEDHSIKINITEPKFSDIKPQNVLIATARPRPHKKLEQETILIENGEPTIEMSIPEKQVISETKLAEETDNYETNPEVQKSSMEPIIEKITKISEITEDIPEEKLLMQDDSQVSTVQEVKNEFLEELSQLKESMKGLEADKTIGGINPKFGEIRVDEMDRLISILSNIENVSDVYVRDKQEIAFNRGYLLQDGYITHLNLSNLGLTLVPKYLESLSKLTALDLEKNNFESFPKDLMKLTSLEELNLSDNKMKSLTSSIGVLTNLKYIWLYDNDLSNIPEMSSLTNLEHLDLRGNNLSEIGIDAIYSLHNLKFLSLESNNLRTLSEKIDSLANLEMLLVGNNPIEKFPDFPNLKNLKELSLYGTKLKNAPESILFLTNLKVLDIWNTSIRPDDWVLMDLKFSGLNIKTDTN